MIDKQYNSNLLFLINNYKNNAGVILEGSSRSGKTWSSLFFIIYLAATEEDRKTFVIVKETYNSFKTTLYDDFSRILDMFGLDNPFLRSKEISTFNIFNHKVHMVGADNPSKFHGMGSDYLYYNELLNISKDVFNQAEQRCRLFFWGDYNPSVSLHYIYDSVIPRDDVKFLKTTYKDNPFISAAELKKIESYEPTPENKRQGTADDYMWNVYGLGKRMNRTGLIFQNINWIDSFPTDIEQIAYGMDFGFTTDPTALVKLGVNGNNLYIQGLVYEPTENAEALYPILKALELTSTPIWADSASPGMISDLNNKGCQIYAIKKFNGSIKYGIGLLKSYKIHIVRDKDFQKEQENYAWRTINGLSLDEPVDKFNHYWDAARYGAMANFRR